MDKKYNKIHLFSSSNSEILDDVKKIVSTEFQIAHTVVGAENIAYDESMLGVSESVIIIIFDENNRSNFLDLCSHIKNSIDLQHVEILVIDRSTTIEEKVEIYDVGVSDLISYPYEDLELLKKISLATFRASHLEESSLQAKSAMETAMNAIMDAGELGTVIHFLRDSFSSKSLEHLADLIVESGIRFGLSSSVQIRTSWEPINRTSSDSLSPLEIQMLSALQNSGRIHQKGKRLLLNFGPISQIIKNLPEEDEFKCGRLRDHLALILEGANSRMKSLLITEDLTNLLEETKDSIKIMHDRQSEQKKQNVKIMDSMLEEIQGEFFRHGLTEEQESLLISMVDKYVEKIFSTYEAGLKVDEEMVAMVDKLKSSISKFTN